MRGTRIAGLFAFGLVVATLAAGASAYGGSQPSLSGTGWQLTGWAADSLDPVDFTITADFTDDTVGGTSAVNQYGGPYTAAGDGSFTAGPLAGTKMAGPEPAMRAEKLYLDMLDRAAAYAVEGATLTLSDGEGNELLIFAGR